MGRLREAVQESVIDLLTERMCQQALWQETEDMVGCKYYIVASFLWRTCKDTLEYTVHPRSCDDKSVRSIYRSVVHSTLR